MRSKEQMVKDLLALQNELSQLHREKMTCMWMGEGYSLNKERQVEAECWALTQAELKLQEAAQKIREGY
jgi:CHAD domain-containing protein